MILQDGFFALIPVSSFRAKPSIFLAHRLSCRMTLLVCIFSMRSHTHHFPSCHKDPSVSLGMTRREERCLSYMGANPLPFGHPPSKGRGYDSPPPSSGRRGPKERRLASRMFDYPYPRIVMRGVARNLSCTSAFLPDGSTGLHLFHAISHSPFSLLPGRSLGFARDDTVGRALSIIHGSQPPALRASPFQRKGVRLSPSFLWKEVPRRGGG